MLWTVCPSGLSVGLKFHCRKLRGFESHRCRFSEVGVFSKLSHTLQNVPQCRETHWEHFQLWTSTTISRMLTASTAALAGWLGPVVGKRAVAISERIKEALTRTLQIGRNLSMRTQSVPGTRSKAKQTPEEVWHRFLSSVCLFVLMLNTPWARMLTTLMAEWQKDFARNLAGFWEVPPEFCKDNACRRDLEGFWEGLGGFRKDPQRISGEILESSGILPDT